MKTAEIRQAFIDYFTAREHQLVLSASLIPSNDPTLLFTNAGMVQFKDIFLGRDSASYPRAVSVQRCVRAGGKHNDLENVGYTARHHTFFEMLGNFSFGDYFKREAIVYAWEFITQILKLPSEKLWITVFQDDNEAADIWLKEIGVAAERFSRCGEKDNFWSMGDTGPCGPCTEIFYDHGADIAGGPPGTVDAEGDRYIEIWNLVFMQYNRDKNGTLHPLPKPSVDTGMGLERIAAVVQGVHSNYEIDVFQYLIKSIIALLPKKVAATHTSLKVIADHIRACSFLIADGVLPSNEGRGYVLRRIVRRAVRHGNKLGLPTPFFCHLVVPLIQVMGDAYPELLTHQSHIEQVLAQEEKQFARTLEQGLRLLQEHIQSLADSQLPGHIAFKLYDTYGFPLDLTEDIAREQRIAVDVEGFNHCMLQQRRLSQSASQFTTDYSTTALQGVITTFHGYEVEKMASRIGIILAQDKKIEQLKPGMRAGLILEETPFYAESGGQVGDQGKIHTKNAVFNVEDTQYIGQAIVHYGELVQGELQLSEMVTAEINQKRRAAIRLNHTATHLLHAALKEVVGPHIQQRGSLVDAARTRFDFSHGVGLTREEWVQLEMVVNEQIRANYDVITECMSLEKAKDSGAIALFGEKYSEAVRVLTLGSFSKELCGGTHASRTGDIGLFKIVAEYGIASGIRRIEMVTGAYALAWIDKHILQLETIAKKLKTNADGAVEKLTQFLTESKQQEKTLAELQVKLAAQSSYALVAEAQKVGTIHLLVKQLEAVDSQILRSTLDQVKNSLQDAVVVLFTIEDNKIQIVAGISKHLIGRVPSAVAFVKHLCGKGGGRDDVAQGGGIVPPDLQERITAIRGMI